MASCPSGAIEPVHNFGEFILQEAPTQEDSSVRAPVETTIGILAADCGRPGPFVTSDSAGSMPVTEYPSLEVPPCEPTPAEIAAACWIIRQDWTQREEMTRRGVDYTVRYEIPQVRPQSRNMIGDD